MKLDRWTWVIGSLSVAVAVVLGWLAAAWAGALSALAGLVSAVLWQIAANRRGTQAAQTDILDDALVALAPPGPADAEAVPGGVARFLRPEEAVVSFWPRPELASLREWLISTRRMDVQLVTGAGGAGKTRLALELTREATEDYGWRCYWPQPGNDSQVAAAVGLGTSPSLVVLDYAETVPQLPDLLARLLARPAVPSAPVVRVLMLARSAGEWWHQLVAECGTMLGERLAAMQPIVLGAITEPSTQQEIFEEAVLSFSARLGKPCPSGSHSLVAASDTVILVVHAAALLAVLDGQSPGSGGDAIDSAQVIDRLLLHEARYWQQSQARYTLSLGPAVTRRVVAAGTLAGADDESSAVRMLAAIEDLGDAATRGRAARWLHDLYPVARSATAPAEWIGPLRPELIAESLAVSVLMDQPDLFRALVAALPPHRVGRILRVLARQVDAMMSEADPAELMKGVRAVRARLPDLIRESFDSASRETYQRLEGAGALGGRVAPLTSDAALPKWLRLSIQETLLTWGTGRGRTCLHDPTMKPLVPVFSAAWKPWLVVCPRCTPMLTVRGGRGSEEDNTCDACRRVVSRTGDDFLQPSMVTVGPLTYMFGACKTCREELETLTQ